MLVEDGLAKVRLQGNMDGEWNLWLRRFDASSTPARRRLVSRHLFLASVC